MQHVYLITHGDRKYGKDPGHTGKGFKQIRALIHDVPPGISQVVVGTGRRFQEIYEVLFTRLAQVPVEYSPFAGSADSFDKNKNLILACGVVVPGNEYIGLKRTDAFDPWRFLSILPDLALLCSGGELLGALGFKDIDKKGCLYEIDVKKRAAKVL